MYGDVEGDAFTLTIPPWRPDVSREVDVIEEIIRLVGLGRLPNPPAVRVPLAPVEQDRLAALLDRMRRRAAILGFHDLATNSLVSAQTAEAYADPAWTGHGRAVVETLNPVSQEMAALRPSLLPGLVQAAAYNAARGADALRLVDVGHVYGRAEVSDATLVDGYAEAPHIALAMTGLAQRQSWSHAARAVDFYDLKGVVLDLLADAGCDGRRGDGRARAVGRPGLPPRAVGAEPAPRGPWAGSPRRSRATCAAACSWPS